jgi:hypothetical protein
MILRFLLGCSHQRFTFPLTPTKRGFRKPTYVVCLDCGKEFRYDWQQMRIGRELKQDSPSRCSSSPGHVYRESRDENQRRLYPDRRSECATESGCV